MHGRTDAARTTELEIRRHAAPIAATRAGLSLGVGVVLVAVFAATIGRPGADWVFLAVAAYGATLSVLGAWNMPRALRRVWVALAAYQLCSLTGDTLWTVFEDVVHIDPYPSVADAAYLASYPSLALAMLWLVRGRRGGRDRAAFLDAAIAATGFTVVGVVFFVAPAASSAGTSLLGQAVGAAYPIGDLLVLAVALRLLTMGMGRNVSLWSLLAAVVVLLVVDAAYDVSVTRGAGYPSWIDVGYLLAYLLPGYAALHPSARRLSEPVPHRPARITAVRLSLLGAALVLVPATAGLADLMGFRPSTWAVFAGGCVVAVLVVLRLGDLVADLQRTAVQLAALAEKDGLTGVANRRTWDHELSRACALARETGTALSVAVIDLDHFKLFNDTHGHLAGDLVLKETTAAWVAVLGGRGFLARYGGEEFTVLLPQLDAAEAQGVLERLRRAVSHDQTCSIGLATWDGEETPAEVMSRADQALYRAKGSGRDRVALHHDGVATVVTMTKESPALAALRSVYQPIVDLATGRTVGAEALSRFDGFDPRSVFDDAVRDGSVPLLEARAIRSARAGWTGPGLLSLNVSLSALVSPEVQEALAGDLHGVALEVTEADMVDYTSEVMLTVDDARDRGALIAVDDYGVGFSNVQRIATLRPDLIKLDMSLVRDIHEDPALQAVATSCVLLGRLLSARVVAEGIETEDELACLVGLGVPLGQGYLLGRPGPAPDVLSGGAG